MDFFLDLLDRYEATIHRERGVSERYRRHQLNDLAIVHAEVIRRADEAERYRGTVGFAIGEAFCDALAESLTAWGKTLPPARPHYRCPTCAEYGEVMVRDYHSLTDLYRTMPPIGAFIDTREPFSVWGPSTPWHDCDVPGRCYCTGRSWHREEPAHAGPLRLVEALAC